MKTAKRVYLGSSKPEWNLFVDGVYFGFWNEYHMGPLPKCYIVTN